MGAIYRKRDKFCYSLLLEGQSLLEFRLLELCRTQFVWRGRHSLSFNRFFIVLQGGGHMINHTSGQTLEFHPGVAYFIPPKVDLTYNFTPDTHLISLHFQLQVLPCIDVYEGETECRELHTPGYPTELSEFVDNPNDWGAFCRFQMQNWNNLARLKPNLEWLERYAGLCDRYGRALAYIRDNINADMGVDEVAAIAEAKRDTFSRHFSNDFDIPLKTFIMNELVTTSERYLLHSNLAVREIAEELKFSSEFYFSTFFRRLKGVSPTRFRAMRRKI